MRSSLNLKAARLTLEQQRTITFRFTNISDAVRFKGVLIRDDEWEGCPIEFAEDPCEKATGVHPD